MRPKKPARRSMSSLRRPGRKSLSWTAPCLSPDACAMLRDLDRLVEVGRDRLLAVDVLAGAQRLGEQHRPHLRRAGVEEDRVVLVGERGVEVGAPARDAVRLRERLDLVGVAADQDRVRHRLVAVRQRDAALGADRADRADQVLVHPHPAGDAVHDESESSCRHERLLVQWSGVRRALRERRAGSRRRTRRRPEPSGT